MIQVNSPVLFAPLLLATDGSPSARAVQRLLYAIAQTLQSPAPASGTAIVTVVTVQPRRSSRSHKRAKAALPPAPISEADPETSEASKSLPPLHEPTLTEFPDKLAAAIRADFPTEIPVALEVRRGRPATEILNCARTLEAGLIAVGQRGTGGVRELLLGSVSSVIARYAPCSVLIARGAGIESQTELHLQHVLVVVDGSAADRRAMAAVRQLIPAGIQQVTLLCIQSPLNANYLFGPFVTPPRWQLSQSLQAAQKEEGEQILNRARASLQNPTLTVQTLLQVGDPGPLICQVAQQQQANLVILASEATRRSLLAPLQSLRKPRSNEKDKEKDKEKDTQAHKTALRNTRLSTTEDYAIHHTPCPVLLCRAKG